MSKKPRLIFTLPLALKQAVEQAAEHRGCSQAEIVKAALYEHLRQFLSIYDKEVAK